MAYLTILVLRGHFKIQAVIVILDVLLRELVFCFTDWCRKAENLF